MTTITLAEYLRWLRDQQPMTPVGPMLVEGSDPPDGNTSTWCAFRLDANENTYGNRARTGSADDWFLIIPGSVLTDGEKFLVGDVD